LVDANAHAKAHPAFPAPLLIELSQFPSHAKRRASAIFGVLRHAKTAHIPPYGHNCVSNEFIERAAIAEDDRRHPAEMLIELRDQDPWISFFG